MTLGGHCRAGYLNEAGAQFQRKHYGASTLGRVTWVTAGTQLYMKHSRVGHLNGGRSPVDEAYRPPPSDICQTAVHLTCVNLPLHARQPCLDSCPYASRFRV